jgi:dienelactone hydrolase
MRIGPAWAKFALGTLLAAGSISAAVPDTDARNTEFAGFKTHFTMPEYTSRKQWEARKDHLRRQILSAAGLLPLPARTPLRPSVVRRFEYPDYAIEAVLIETLPGFYLGGNLYLPVGKKGPFPGVLVPHGHWKRGRLEDLPSYSVPALGINLARQGYVAFAYDMVGYNDTQQTSHSFGGWDEELWSFSPMGLQLWNSMRALDYLQSLPDVDGRRIAVTGASGGGSQTFLLAAVDDRVGYAAPVNMVSAYMQGGDPCEEAPSLRLDTFNVEIAAMMAPRPMLVVSSTRDWTRHTPSEEFPAIQRIYALYGVPQNVESVQIDAEHNYNRQSRTAVYHFLARNMLGGLPESLMLERGFTLPPEEDMLVFSKSGSRDLPGYPEVFQAWKTAALVQSSLHPDSDTEQEALRAAIAAEWPAEWDFNSDGHRMVLGRRGKGDRITGLWYPGKGAPVLVVHPDGARAALRNPRIAALIRAHRPVLAIDPFVSGAARDRKREADDYFLSYNRSDDADRVQDILTALAFLKAQGGGRPELIGLDDAGIWCLFAAAIAPVAVDLVADLNGFSGSDENFHDRFFVPGIQRAGGMSAAMGLVSRFRVVSSADADR